MPVCVRLSRGTYNSRNHALLPLTLLLKFLTKSLVTHHQVLMLLDFLSAVPPDNVYPCGGFFNLVNCETNTRFRQVQATINVPITVNTAFQQHIWCRMRPPDNVNVLEWYWE